MSYEAKVLARKPSFRHQIKPQELGITVNNLSVHEYAAPIPAVISEDQEENWRSRNIRTKASGEIHDQNVIRRNVCCP